MFFAIYKVDCLFFLVILLINRVSDLVCEKRVNGIFICLTDFFANETICLRVSGLKKRQIYGILLCNVSASTLL